MKLRIKLQGNTYDVDVEILEGAAPAVSTTGATSTPAPRSAPAAAGPGPTAAPLGPQTRTVGTALLDA